MEEVRGVSGWGARSRTRRPIIYLFQHLSCKYWRKRKSRTSGICHATWDSSRNWCGYSKSTSSEWAVFSDGGLRPYRRWRASRLSKYQLRHADVQAYANVFPCWSGTRWYCFKWRGHDGFCATWQWLWCQLLRVWDSTFCDALVYRGWRFDLASWEQHGYRAAEIAEFEN